MRFLRVLRLGFEDPHFVGQAFLAVELDDHVADLGHRFLCDVERVGAHVRDETHLAVADVDALVQLLRRAHGFLRTERELARGLLLQRRGGERGGRVAPPLFLVDLQDRENALSGFAQRALDFTRLLRGGEAELFDLGTGVLDQLARKFLFRVFEFRVHGPVFARDEGGDFILALADHAQRRTLHAPGGKTGPDLLPQQRRQVEAHEEIQGAAGLLGVHQLQGQLARPRHRLAHGILGDFVEYDARHGLAFELAERLQELVQMPGNRFAFAVGVGREEQGIRLLQGA